jgi:transcriptional regulator with XRE-family HTH domain
MDRKNYDFANFLKQIRTSKKITLVELADAAGTSNSYLSQLENSKRNPPKPNMIKKIAHGLSLSDPVEEKRIYNALMEKAGYIITGSLIKAFTPNSVDDDRTVKITYRGENDSSNTIITDFDKVDQLFNLDVLLNNPHFRESTTNSKGLTADGPYEINLNYKGSELSLEQKKTLRYLLDGMHQAEQK